MNITFFSFSGHESEGHQSARGLAAQNRT